MSIANFKVLKFFFFKTRFGLEIIEGIYNQDYKLRTDWK